MRAAVLVTLVLIGSAGDAQGEIALDPERVVALARREAPVVRVAEAHLGEVRALRVGARAPAVPNPEVGFSTGPRALVSGMVVDLIGTLVVPIDVSGAPSLRASMVEDRVRVAEADADNVRRLAIADALDAWVVALGAEERVQLEGDRARLDDSLWRSAEARRRAGTIGDVGVQLAAVLRADGLARLRRAEGARDAALIGLRARLGLDHREPIKLIGALVAAPVPSLDALLARVARRPDLVGSERAIQAAATDARLQLRLGVPAPRVTASGGRDGDLFARFTLEAPLPLFQRNQTARAVAVAHRATVAADRDRVLFGVEADVRAAYATYLGALRAVEALDAAAPAMIEAEHLATRAYELGQATLPDLIVARRETSNTRAAHLDAKIALARARFALDAAAGVVP